MLLAAQQLACAANFQITHGDTEARTELAGLLQGGQALARDHRQALVAVVEHVGIGPHRGATDTATQLIKLRQAELVGAVDDDGVGRGNIEAALDDRRADQHLELAVGKGQHDLLQLALRHLAVADAERCLGHQPLQPSSDLADTLHAVVHEEDLPATVDLAQNGLADQGLVVFGDGGGDRQALLGRRLDRAQIAYAGHAHVESARDRRSGQRQHVNHTAHLFDALFVRHTKPLLLVHDQQPQVLDHHVFG